MIGAPVPPPAPSRPHANGADPIIFVAPVGQRCTNWSVDKVKLRYPKRPPGARQRPTVFLSRPWCGTHAVAVRRAGRTQWPSVVRDARSGRPSCGTHAVAVRRAGRTQWPSVVRDARSGRPSCGTHAVAVRRARSGRSLGGVQLNVDDGDEVHAFLRRQGVDVSDVSDYPWGRFCFFSDPDGNRWSVHGPLLTQQAYPPRNT